MTHILIMQGTATGGPAARTLNLATVTNDQAFDALVLTYVEHATLTLTRVTNANTFDTPDLELVAVSELTATVVTNVNTFDTPALALLPFEAENAETTALLAVFTGDYSTTRKIQLDRMIGGLKTAGVWSKLDWFYGGKFTANEHDSLVDWTTPARSLVKVGSPTYTAFVGWQGVTPATTNAKLKSGWNVGDGPHSTGTSLTLFMQVESEANENNMQVAGAFQNSSPGPSAPVGTFLILNNLSGNFSGGANTVAFDGVSGAAVAGPPNCYSVVRNGGTVNVYADGVIKGTDAVAGSGGFTHADGFCILGTPTAFGAGRAFNGLVSYGGWGGALTAGELAAVVAAVAAALAPVDPDAGLEGVLLINDDLDYLGDESGDYVITDGP